MSCFESSTFLKNPDVLNQEVLISACKKLGWKNKIGIIEGLKLNIEWAKKNWL